MTDKEKIDAAAKRLGEKGWTSQLKKKVQAHFAKRKEARQTTARTKQVTASLKNAGLSADELKRLRGQ